MTIVPQLRRAVAYAMTGEAQASYAAIGLAQDIFGRAPDKPTNEWCTFVTQAEIDGVAGTCAVRLGDTKRAEATLERAISRHGSQFIRNRALYRVRLATARIDAGSVDGALQSAGSALDDLSGELTSAIIAGELREVALKLAGYRMIDGVEEFLDRYSSMK